MTARSKANQATLKKMRRIYYPKDSLYLDWMGYKITEDNKPSYHHIKKREELIRDKENASATVENGAYLGKHSHEKLHEVEILDLELYDSWKYIFQVINNMGIYPIPDVWKMVENLKEQTETLLQEEPKVLIKKKKETAKQIQKNKI
jgi:hypothetical protein